MAAPGVNVLLVAPGGSGYVLGTGTSISSPYVAGLVALYIAAHGRATNGEGVARIRQAIIDASLPQSQWRPHGHPFDAITNNTGDPDSNPEPLAIASEDWIPKPTVTSFSHYADNSQIGFDVVPGYDYTVQSATDLDSPSWTNLTTVSGSNFITSVSAVDTNGAVRNFYRLARNPSTPYVPAAPSLPWDIHDRIEYTGSNTAFTAVANGTPPLGYQWFKDETPLSDDERIVGARTWILSLNNLQSTDAGGYFFVVTNAYGSVTSSIVTLTVQSP